jgi:hypothetical protein
MIQAIFYARVVAGVNFQLHVAEEISSMQDVCYAAQNETSVNSRVRGVRLRARVLPR